MHADMHITAGRQTGRHLCSWVVVAMNRHAGKIGGREASEHTTRLEGSPVLCQQVGGMHAAWLGSTHAIQCVKSVCFHTGMSFHQATCWFDA